MRAVREQVIEDLWEGAPSTLNDRNDAAASVEQVIEDLWA